MADERATTRAARARRLNDLRVRQERPALWERQHRAFRDGEISEAAFGRAIAETFPDGQPKPLTAAELRELSKDDERQRAVRLVLTPAESVAPVFAEPGSPRAELARLFAAFGFLSELPLAQQGASVLDDDLAKIGDALRVALRLSNAFALHLSPARAAPRRSRLETSGARS